MPQSQFIKAALLCLFVAIVCHFLSGLLEIGGKHPLEASALAVLLGLFVRNSRFCPQFVASGFKKSEALLVWGIILMGASLDFSQIGSQSVTVLVIIVVTMLCGFFVIKKIGSTMSLPATLVTLLAAGTTICGGTAIAIIAPLLKARDEDTSYAIATISLWGLIAILLYPQLALLIGMSDIQFGVFAGTAIHSTPQVVGAGFIFSEAAGKTATAVKLVRNCFIAPLSLLIAFGQSADTRPKGIKGIAKAFPWFLFGYFLMAYLNTAGLLPRPFIEFSISTGKFLILMGMVGVGLNTEIGSIRKAGKSPLVLGFWGAVIVAGISAVMCLIALPS
jgi:uncharacterized integral membrane protein (TIGR00698 family)